MNLDDLTSRNAPTSADVERQRMRLDDAIRAAAEPSEVTNGRQSNTLRPRWKPVGLLAACTLAAAILVAVAILPTGDNQSPSKRPERPRLQLVKDIPGGAFAGLNLDTASAADVLKTAGKAATNGITAEDAEWEYTRVETSVLNTRTVTERWMSPESDMSFMLHATIEKGSTTGRMNAHFENLERGVIGDVHFSDGSVSAERRATWDTRQPDANLVLFTRLVGLLRSARSPEDVGDALDELLPERTTKFDRNGYMCQGTGCMGIGPTVVGNNRLAVGEGRTVFTRAFLLQSLANNVYSGAVTKAVYDYLASDPQAEFSRARANSDDLVMRYRTRGERPAVIEEATLDGGTGRIVAWGPAKSWQQRWVAWGRASAPVVGGVLCEDYPNACRELRDLSVRIEKDPKARFRNARLSGDAKRM